MGTVASKLWPPFLPTRDPGRQPQPPAAVSPPSTPATQETEPADPRQEYEELLENMRRSPSEVRRTDLFFLALFCLITVAWIAAAVIWWLRR
jgi:hypothetical protein